jgi:hypothetical protein
VSIQKIPANFLPTGTLVNPSSGIPTTSYGWAFLNALFQRTGGGTGIVPSVSPPLTATGTTIANALQLTADWNNVTTVGTGTGVAIASGLNLQPGNDIWVFNSGANNLNVYPPSPQIIIDALGAGAPYVLVPGKLRCFQCWTAVEFNSYGN